VVPKPTIVATVIRHDPTNANSVLLLLVLRALTARWVFHDRAVKVLSQMRCNCRRTLDQTIYRPYSIW
jgi:hypothetical protein